MISGVDLTRTHEVIEMLDEIYDSVEEGCKDRCYIKGSCAESVKWVLEQACEYLRIYALTSTTQLVEINKDVNISEVIDMMKTKLNSNYGMAALEAGKEVGTYEMETLYMFRLSLMKSETLEADKEKCQQLQRYAKTDMASVYGKAALEAGKEDNEQ